MRIITTDQQGHTKLVSERFPLPVTVKDSVPFYLSSDITSFTTEFDPCLWRRAIAQVVGDNLDTSPNDIANWTLAQAGGTTIQMPAQRGVSLLFSSTAADNFTVGLIDTSNGALISSAGSYNINRSIADFNLASGDAKEFYRRCKPIRFRTREYIPTAIHFQSQSSLGAQNNANAQQQVLAAYIGAVYPVSETNDALDVNTARWIVMPISQANNVQFGRFTLPNPHSLGGLASGSGVQVGAVTYSFPFPTITPFWSSTTEPPSWYWYFVALGYFNLTTSTVQHPWGAVWVEAEVRPQ